jgi:hypothetical protein
MLASLKPVLGSLIKGKAQYGAANQKGIPQETGSDDGFGRGAIAIA